MNNLNKITHTRVGDNIHYFQNGQEARGVIVKMNNAYVSVLKDTGVIDEIHINETFFVKDIITNKSWNDMDLEERVVELQKAHAFSPRFISKTWEELPQELRDVLLKTNLEETTLGQVGGNRAGVSTDTDVKAPEDYKGESDEGKKEEFKHEEKKPSVDKKKAHINKNNAMEESSKKVDDMQQDWRPTGANEKKADKEVELTEGGKKVLHEAKRYASLDMYKSMPLWKTWLEKDAPDDTTIKPPSNTPKKKDPQSPENWQKNIGAFGFQDQSTDARHVDSKYDDKYPDQMVVGNTGKKRVGLREIKSPHDHATTQRATGHAGTGLNDDNEQNRFRDRVIAGVSPYYVDEEDRDKSPNLSHRVGSKKSKQYGKPLYGVTSLEKEGDGAGNTGVNSTDTTGVYNARYSDKDGRYKDQERDTDKKGEEKDDGKRSED